MFKGTQTKPKSGKKLRVKKKQSNKKKKSNKRKSVRKQKGGDGYLLQVEAPTVGGQTTRMGYSQCCPPTYIDGKVAYTNGGNMLCGGGKKKKSKSKSKKNTSKIYYTGIGAKKGGIHTEEEFMKAMKQFSKGCKKFMKKKKCNVDDYIKWSGAKRG